MIYTITLSWNGLNHLKKLYPGLVRNIKNTNIDHQVCIRDNGSRDGSKEWLVDQDIKVLNKDHNRDNFAVGVNSLIEYVKPDEQDYILLLNNDIVFKDNNSLLRMMRVLERTKSAICGARLMYPGSNKISHSGVVLSGTKGSMPWNYRMGFKVEDKDKKDRYFQAVTAACCLFKAKTFYDVGGLNTRYHWAFEDVDFCLKVSNKEKVVCCGSTEIEHGTSVSLQKNPVNKMFLQQNVKYFKEKWFGKYELDHEKYLKNPNYNIVK